MLFGQANGSTQGLDKPSPHGTSVNNTNGINDHALPLPHIFIFSEWKSLNLLVAIQLSRHYMII